MSTEAEEHIAVRRPERWSQPMDTLMSNADISWLRSREPFSSMDESVFPRSTPIDGILRGDTKLHRCEPGEIIVREGDYGNSAFLVLAGEVSVMVDSLAPEQLGRQPPQKRSWSEALGQYAGRWLKRQLTGRDLVEARTIEQVTPNLNAHSQVASVGSSQAPNAQPTLRQVDDRPAIFLQDFSAVLRDSNTVTLGPSELFGEVAAMYRSPRSATVIAKTEAALLEIRWQGLKILRRDRSFADRLDQHYRDHWLKVHLQELPLLRHVPESNMERVVEATQLRSFGRMEWNADYKKTRKLPVEQQIASEPLVAREGASPTDLIVVRSGFGRLSQAYGASERTTAYLGKGHMFGLEEVVRTATGHVAPADHQSSPNATGTSPNTSRAYHNSLRAVGFLDTLQIPIETFATEILPHIRRSELPPGAVDALNTSAFVNESSPPGQDGIDRRRNDRDAHKPRSEKNPATSPSVQQFQSTGLLEFIVENRLNNGRQAMVIDLHRCTRCDDCVKACAATHDGNPRFVRGGVTHDRLQFAHACMQCDDPVCMIGCPTGAISRNLETGVVGIHESICVGCGVCASACPYDHINMVAVQDKKGLPFVDQKTGNPIRKATKCDMCETSLNGPACQAACPHDALVRIDLTESKPLRDWLDQRGAS